MVLGPQDAVPGHGLVPRPVGAQEPVADPCFWGTLRVRRRVAKFPYLPLQGPTQGSIVDDHDDNNNPPGACPNTARDRSQPPRPPYPGNTSSPTQTRRKR